jgi:gamma-glutamyltranspeptidase
VCRAETAGLVEADLAAIEARLGPVVRFDSPHMYFGGLHVVRAHPDGRLDGAGDPRRGGAFGVT